MLFTSRPGTASPIQNGFTGIDAFSIFQDVELQRSEGARVTNVVVFGESVGVLRVAADASIESRKLPGKSRWSLLCCALASIIGWVGTALLQRIAAAYY